MAARFKKPKDDQSKKYPPAGVIFDDPADVRMLRKTRRFGDAKPKEEEYQLNIRDYIKYSPTIAKELGKSSPQILREIADPVGSVSAEKLSEAINPEISRALSGSGLQPQQVGSLEMNPKMAALARMIPGATSALTNSNLGSMFSMDTANKAFQNALGLSKKGITKADLAWLGLFYGQPVKNTKRIFKGVSKLLP